MSDTVVWAYQPLKELNNETGMVVCDEQLAKKLLESGKVENPQDGAWHLTPIGETKDLSGYQTKEMKPAPKKRAKKD